MYTKRLLAVLALTCLPAPLAAEAELEARFWLPDIDGTLQVTEGSQGTRLALPGDLGIDDEEATEVRLTWRLPGPLVIRFGYMPLGYNGNVNLSQDIDFGGITFPVAFDLSSNLDLDYARAGVGWMFRLNEELRFGPMLELKALRAEADLRGSILGIPLAAASESIEVGFGAIGVGFDASPLPTLHILGEASYSPGFDYGEMIEAEVSVKFSPIKIVSVFGGYRVITFDLEDRDDTLDLDLSGPFVGASLSF